MQALNYISSSHKLNYLSPLIGDVDSYNQFRINDNIDTDNSSSSSPRHDFDSWYSRRSSPTMKSDHCSENEDDEEADEVLSVGCESPPPTITPTTTTTSSESLKKKTLTESHQALKFSIDNILRPEFGERIRKSATKLKSKRAADDSPVDLSKECSDSKNSKTESDSGSGSEGNMMWPAWVYCTRYSDRPSSGKYLLFKLIIYESKKLLIIETKHKPDIISKF